MKKISLLLAVALIASCSHKPIQTVKIKTDLNYLANSEIGNDKKIELLVFDLRPNKTYVGKKQCGKQTIDIRSDVNIANLIQEQLVKGLKVNSFIIGKGKVLEVRLEDLTYDAKRSFVGKSEAKINLKVVVRDNSGSTKFSKNYKTEIAKKHFIAPLPSTDAETINFIINEGIRNILEDNNLLELLAAK